MPIRVRAKVDLHLLNELVHLADQLPGETPAARGELLAALVEVYRQSVASGHEYRPIGDVTRNTN